MRSRKTSVGLYPIGATRCIALYYFRIMTANELPSKNERQIMHLLTSPVLSNIYYIGGGSVGLLLIIAVVVLLIR